jgi:catechol 2,3-dioxygenase-like lactoylglutathione lyase family enzyme
MSFRFHHVHIICKDLEKMIGFFTEGLGADLVRRKKFGTADGASLDLQGTTINLRIARADEKLEGDASRTVYGYNHIGLEVEDIEAAYTDLSAQGYSFFMPPTKRHGEGHRKRRGIPKRCRSRTLFGAIRGNSVSDSVSRGRRIAEAGGFRMVN